MAATRLDSKPPPTWSEELLVENLFPLCPLVSVLNVLMAGRRGTFATNMEHVRRCNVLREQVLDAVNPALWEGLRCPPFTGRHFPLLRWVPGHARESFLHYLTAQLGVHPQHDRVRALARLLTAPLHDLFFHFVDSLSFPLLCVCGAGSLNYVGGLNIANGADEAIHMLGPLLHRHCHELHWLSPRYGLVYLLLLFTVENFEAIMTLT